MQSPRAAGGGCSPSAAHTAPSDKDDNEQLELPQPPRDPHRKMHTGVIRFESVLGLKKCDPWGTMEKRNNNEASQNLNLKKNMYKCTVNVV